MPLAKVTIPAFGLLLGLIYLGYRVPTVGVSDPSSWPLARQLHAVGPVPRTIARASAEAADENTEG